MATYTCQKCGMRLLMSHNHSQIECQEYIVWKTSLQKRIQAKMDETEKPLEGLKYDDKKLRWHLLPTEAVRAILDVLQFGSDKYGPWNWRKGMAWTRLYDAALRHLTAFMDGEDRDKESGFLHLAHAGCCILFLLSYQILELGKDDRSKE